MFKRRLKLLAFWTSHSRISFASQTRSFPVRMRVSSAYWISVNALVEAACRFWKIFDIAFTFYKILKNASKILHALQNDCSMKGLENFSMHFAKIHCIFYATYRTLQRSYHFLQKFYFKKSIEKLFWYFYKIFHARYSLLRAIRNWVVVIISWTFLLWFPDTFISGYYVLLYKNVVFQRILSRIFMIPLKYWQKNELNWPREKSTSLIFGK